MPVGPGIYDHLCTVVREEADARIAMVVVINGKDGTGFSVQSAAGEVGVEMLAETLESVARQIRSSLK